MVGWSGVPSCPIAIGSPATLFTINTATAPAACALRILVENVQSPRAMRAIFPARLPEGSAEQAVLRLVPLNTTASGAVKSDSTVANSPIAAAYALPPTGTCAPTKWGAVLAPAVSALPAEAAD